MQTFFPVLLALSMVACQSVDPRVFAQMPQEKIVNLNSIFESDKAIPLDQKNSEVPLKLVTIKTRPLVVQPFLFAKPAQPKASLIIMNGGSGRVEFIEKDGGLKIARSKNYLILTKFQFVNRGISIALLDLPSDRPTELSDSFRSSKAHVFDLDAVAAFLHRESPGPVWIIGVSRGTISTANAMANSHGEIYGGVLTSSMTGNDPKKMNSTVLNFELEDFKGPALVTAHKQDACRSTPPSGVKLIANRLTGAKKVETMYFEGGSTPTGGNCEVESRHTYVGIEKTVADAVADFILENSR